MELLSNPNPNPNQAPGTELLSVQMPFVSFSTAELVAGAQTLPQSHTCDNVLELPNYYAALRARRGLPEVRTRGTRYHPASRDCAVGRVVPC